MPLFVGNSCLKRSLEILTLQINFMLGKYLIFYFSNINHVIIYKGAGQNFWGR